MMVIYLIYIYIYYCYSIAMVLRIAGMLGASAGQQGGQPAEPQQCLAVPERGLLARHRGRTGFRAAASCAGGAAPEAFVK